MKNWYFFYLYNTISIYITLGNNIESFFQYTNNNGDFVEKMITHSHFKHFHRLCSAVMSSAVICSSVICSTAKEQTITSNLIDNSQ